MNQTQAAARMDSQTTPDVRPGQVWKLKGFTEHIYALHVRVVCRYPFARVGDGVLWVIESVEHVAKFERIPEETLRDVYRLLVDTQHA